MKILSVSAHSFFHAVASSFHFSVTTSAGAAAKLEVNHAMVCEKVAKMTQAWGLFVSSRFSL